MSVSRGASWDLPLSSLLLGPPPLTHCPPQQCHAGCVAGGLVTLLLDLAIDIPSLPMTSCTCFVVATLALVPVMGVCPSGLLGILWWLGVLAHQSGWDRLYSVPPTRSFV